jgi:hypothetical protein
MFFSRFKNIDYDGDSIKDLSTAIIIKPAIKANKDLYFWYELEEWETPDSTAFDHYGNSKLNFVVLLLNDIVDPFFDWPLNSNELLALCVERYGLPTITSGRYNTDGYFTVKHWVNDGIIYQDGHEPVNSLAVSHFEYEESLNDAKRRIKVLHPELVPQMNKELDIIFNG